MTLVEFLLARIAEDEARVEGFWSGDGDPDFMWGPGRIRTECAAKRRIVAGAEAIRGDEKTYAQRMRFTDREDAIYVIAFDILRALALPYADHPDYDDSWRP